MPFKKGDALKLVRVLLIVLILSASATAAAAQLGFVKKLLPAAGCTDGDNGPTDPNQPLPFIGIPSSAKDAAGEQFDECIAKDGKKTNQSDVVRERFCVDGKIQSRNYSCQAHGFTLCIDKGKGGACIKILPLPKKCGNKVLDPGEQCDPPGAACKDAKGSPGTCNANCKCDIKPCGNKRLDPGEQCDPPGIDCKDAKGNKGKCNANCKCDTKPAKCGNKKLDPGEQCDPPGSDCKDAKGNKGICSDICACKAPECGNKKVEKPEECDPPGSACKDAKGTVGICTDKCGCQPYIITPKCGNKIVETPEQCDPPGAPAPGCPPLLLPNGGCGFPLCQEGCMCPKGRPCVGLEQIQRGRVTPPTEQLIVPKPPTELTTPQPPKPTKSCEELCAERSRQTQSVDHSQYIMSELQQHRCVSGGSIKTAGTLTVTGPGIECKCYSREPPQISVDPTPPVCDTPCGPVKCDQSASCPCPDQPNCIMHVSCSWGGWKWMQNRAVPIFGPKAQQVAQ